MSEEVKGVFVRLPLSEDRARNIYLECSFEEGGNLEGALCYIGTPVTGGALEPLAYEVLRRGNVEIIYADMIRADDENAVALVRQSDAQAQIAALEAEVVRLREALEGIETANNNLCLMRSNDTYQSMIRDNCGDLLVKLDDARRDARMALKGGAA